MEVIYGAIILVFLVVLIGYSISRSKTTTAEKPAVQTLDIEGIVKETCANTSYRSGEFDINLAEVPDTSWLNIGKDGISLDNFKAMVKWHKRDGKYLFFIEAYACSEGKSILRVSQEVALSRP